MNRIQLTLLLTPVLLAACASPPSPASLIQLEDGSYRTVSVGPSEQQALAASLQVAQSTCRERAMHHVTSNVSTRSRGPWSHPHDRREQAEQLSTYVSSPDFPSLEASDDIEVKLQFKCI